MLLDGFLQGSRAGSLQEEVVEGAREWKGGGEEDCLNGEEWNRRKLAALEISNV